MEGAEQNANCPFLMFVRKGQPVSKKKGSIINVGVRRSPDPIFQKIVEHSDKILYH
jgi:hypothetical protein